MIGPGTPTPTPITYVDDALDAVRAALARFEAIVDSRIAAVERALAPRAGVPEVEPSAPLITEGALVRIVGLSSGYREGQNFTGTTGVVLDVDSDDPDATYWVHLRSGRHAWFPPASVELAPEEDVEPELQPCGRTCETCPAAELCHTADDDGPDVDYAEVAAVLDGTHPGLEANVREDDLRPDYTDALAQAWDTLTVVTSCLADADAGLDDLVPLLDSIPGDELRRPWAHAVAASEHVRGAIRHLNQVRLPIRDDE